MEPILPCRPPDNCYLQDNAGSVPSAPGAPVPVPEEAPPPPAAAKGSKRKLAEREPAGKQPSG